MYLLPRAIFKLSVKKELREEGFVKLALLVETQGLKFKVVFAEEPGAQVGWEVPVVILELSPRVVLSLGYHMLNLLKIHGSIGCGKEQR